MVESLNKTPPYVASAPPGHLPLTRFHTGESTSTEIPVTVYRREQHLNVFGEPSYHWTPDRTGSVSINPAAQLSLWASRPTDVYSRAVVTEPGDALSELDLTKGPQVIKREREELARKADYRARLRRERILDEKTRDPETVHENQSGLSAFETVQQADVNPDAVEYDDRLSGLPVFLNDDEIPSIHANDPNRSGPEYCDHCGEHSPWGTPLERGVNALRDGNGRDGNPSYDHCNPNVINVRSCDCCGCPRCLAKSIRHRKTKEPTWACSNPNCGIEFFHPVERPDEVRDDKTADYRERLYWKCISCGEPTQAPFPGIPSGMLDGARND